MGRPAAAMAVAVLAVGLGGPSAHARGEKGGVRIGVTFGKLDGELADIGIDDYKLGFTVGLTVDVPVSSEVTFQTGLLYTQKGAEGKVDASLLGPFPAIIIDFEVALDYVEIPLVAKASTGSGGGYVLGGLSVGINTKAELTGELAGQSESVDMSDTIESTDIALVLGAGYVSRDGRMSAGIQYSLGLTDVEDGPGETKTSVISASVGFSM